jgi:hypothetical protein
MRDVDPILSHLKAAHAAFLAACENIPAAQWTRPPAKGGWSAGEVVAHLTMVETRVLQGMKEALGKTPAPVPIWKRLHLPVSLTAFRVIKVKTPIPLDPALLKTREKMLEDYTGLRNHALALLVASHQKDLSVYRFPHPFMGSLHLYDWFRMLAYHQTRHKQQIQEIAKSFQK